MKTSDLSSPSNDLVRQSVPLDGDVLFVSQPSRNPHIVAFQRALRAGNEAWSHCAVLGSPCEVLETKVGQRAHIKMLHDWKAERAGYGIRVMRHPLAGQGDLTDAVSYAAAYWLDEAYALGEILGGSGLDEGRSICSTLTVRTLIRAGLLDPGRVSGGRVLPGALMALLEEEGWESFSPADDYFAPPTLGVFPLVKLTASLDRLPLADEVAGIAARASALRKRALKQTEALGAPVDRCFAMRVLHDGGVLRWLADFRWLQIRLALTRVDAAPRAAGNWALKDRVAAAARAEAQAHEDDREVIEQLVAIVEQALGQIEASLPLKTDAWRGLDQAAEVQRVFQAQARADSDFANVVGQRPGAFDREHYEIGPDRTGSAKLSLPDVLPAEVQAHLDDHAALLDRVEAVAKEVRANRARLDEVLDPVARGNLEGLCEEWSRRLDALVRDQTTLARDPLSLP